MQKNIKNMNEQILFYFYFTALYFYHNWSWSSHIPAQTDESVKLLGKEHSSDQCHMMQEVCQHFSSGSLAIGRGAETLQASKSWTMEAIPEQGDALYGSVSGSTLVN